MEFSVASSRTVDDTGLVSETGNFGTTGLRSGVSVAGTRIAPSHYAGYRRHPPAPLG